MSWRDWWSGWRGHLITGALLVGLAYYFIVYLLKLAVFDPLTSVFLIGIGVFTTLLPDLDSDISVINTLFERVFLGAGLIGLLAYFFVWQDWKVFVGSLTLIAYIFSLKFTHHHGFYHGFAFAGIISLIFGFLLGFWFGVFAGLGVIFHLLNDQFINRNSHVLKWW